MGLEPKESNYKTSKVVVIPAPYEATTSYGVGTVKGPAAILEASHQVEYYDIELQKHCHTVGIHTRPMLPMTNAPVEEAFKMLHKEAKQALDDDKFPIMIGGEHTISYGIFKALIEKYPDLSIFHIDAHTDMRAEYEGTPYSHASIMHLMRKECPRSVSIGIRSMCQEEVDYVKKHNVPVYYAHETFKNGLNEEEVLCHLTDNVFLTIDVDGLSADIMPTTGTPEPGGLGWYETLSILKRLFKTRNVVGMDAVELMPIPGLHYGEYSVAKLIYKCIGYKYYQ